jgi:hypothetical protein
MIGEPRMRAYAELFVATTMVGVESEAEAERLLESARRTLEDDGDRWGLAAADSAEAWFAVVRGEIGRSYELARRGRAAFVELGDGWGELQALEPLAVHAEISGELVECRALGAYVVVNVAAANISERAV